MDLRLAVLSVHTCPLAPLGGWETGGMNVYVREVSRELAARGVKVDVFTRRQNSDTPDSVEFAPGARVVHLEAGPTRPLDKYDVIEYLPEFACGVQRFRMLQGQRYDLVHAHYWLSMRPGRQFRALWQVPLVAQFHTLAPLKNRVAHDDAEREFRERLDLERSALAEADRVIALSRTDSRQMVEHYGARSDQIVVIPGGVDLQRFHPGSRQEARRELGLRLDDAILLFVGRIQRLKGIEVLLRAAAELVEPGRLGRPLRVLIVGGQTRADRQRGPEQAELARLRALANRLELDDRVTFVGAVEQSRLPLFYRAANVTVMPSSYESFGLVAAESMACGTPVVASQVGGLRSLVQDDETGFLIPWRHPNLFAERIAQIVTTPRLAERLSTGAVQAMRRLSWGAAADRLLEQYAELIETNRLNRQALLAGSPGSS